MKLESVLVFLSALIAIGNGNTTPRNFLRKLDSSPSTNRNSNENSGKGQEQEQEQGRGHENDISDHGYNHTEDDGFGDHNETSHGNDVADSTYDDKENHSNSTKGNYTDHESKDGHDENNQTELVGYDTNKEGQDNPHDNGLKVDPGSPTSTPKSGLSLTASAALGSSPVSSGSENSPDSKESHNGGEGTSEDPAGDHSKPPGSNNTDPAGDHSKPPGSNHTDLEGTEGHGDNNETSKGVNYTGGIDGEKDHGANETPDGPKSPSSNQNASESALALGGSCPNNVVLMAKFGGTNYSAVPVQVLQQNGDSVRFSVTNGWSPNVQRVYTEYHAQVSEQYVCAEEVSITTHDVVYDAHCMTSATTLVDVYVSDPTLDRNSDNAQVPSLCHPPSGDTDTNPKVHYTFEVSCESRC